MEDCYTSEIARVKVSMCCYDRIRSCSSITLTKFEAILYQGASESCRLHIKVFNFLALRLGPLFYRTRLGHIPTFDTRQFSLIETWRVLFGNLLLTLIHSNSYRHFSALRSFPMFYEVDLGHLSTSNFSPLVCD